MRDPLIDTLAGKYRLVSRLGAGGMGDVYKGVHETIGSKVAIKLLHATAARDRSAQERFLLEAKAVNRIDHNGIVKVLDAGRLDNGRPFLVMELLDGDSLHELRKKGKLTIEEGCSAMIDVLDALAAAHAAGVIHRDLKPANLFRTRDGRIVVLDFGVAKMMAADAPVRLTLTGGAVGTPHYMAPEQIRGKPATPAFDIYAAGVVLFELACGRRPFDGEQEDVVLEGHLERRPPPPRALEAAVSQELQDVILKALAKDPEKRFASAAEMRDALRAATASPLRPAPKPRARSPWARPEPGEAPAPGRESLAMPTVRQTPAKIPKTERDNRTPSGVVKYRERMRTRVWIAVGGAALLAFGAVLLVVATRSPKQVPVDAQIAMHDAWMATPIDASIDATAIARAPADAPPDCAQLVTSQLPGVAADRRAEVHIAMIKRCDEDRWAPDVIWCYVASTNKSCPQGLSDEQRARLDTAIAAATKPQPTPKTKSKPKTEPVLDPYERDGIKNPFATMPRKARLEVESSPSQARVYIDGKLVGLTPWSGELEPTTVTVSIKHSGYESHTTSLRLEASRRNIFKTVLQKPSANELMVPGRLN